MKPLYFHEIDSRNRERNPALEPLFTRYKLLEIERNPQEPRERAAHRTTAATPGHPCDASACEAAPLCLREKVGLPAVEARTCPGVAVRVLWPVMPTTMVLPRGRLPRWPPRSAAQDGRRTSVGWGSDGGQQEHSIIARA